MLFKNIDITEFIIGYKFYQGYDAPGNDIRLVHFNDIEELVKLANSTPHCKGFNTNGWLKFDVDEDKLKEQPQFTNGGIFIKL